MTEIQVQRVTTRRQLSDFIELPYRVLDDDPIWVPPLRLDARQRLNPRKSPFHEHAEVDLLLVRRHGRPVARAAGFVDHNHDQVHGDDALLFGWFEAEDDRDAVAALFGELESMARARGRDRLVGPLTFSINEEAGLLIEGFDRPHRIMTPYNSRHLPELMDELGFSKLHDLLGYDWNFAGEPPEKLKRIAKRVLARPDLRVDEVRIERFAEDEQALYTIYNDAFETTWGHVPLTRREFAAMAADLKRVGEPRLTFIARIDGEPAAFGLTVPDWNQALARARGRLFPLGLLRILLARRSIDAARFIVLATRQRFRGDGLAAPIMLRTMENFVRLGYTDGELSMVLESNEIMRQIIENLIGGIQSKRYRIYERPVPPVEPPD